VVILNQEEHRFLLCSLVGSRSKCCGFIYWPRVKHHWLSLPRYESGAWPLIHSSTRARFRIWARWPYRGGGMSSRWRPADYYTKIAKYESDNRSRKGSRKMCSSYPRPLLTRNGCPIQSGSTPWGVSGSDWSELAASCTCRLLQSGFERTL
jgi:hypothetical protein